jgi:glycosyltransferase involved in cell wall biosynthesis
MIEISVVIPTHNRSAWLRLTLQSVLWQRDADLEVIVVDDGSTDDTARAVTALGDSRIRLLRHDTPRGVSATRNHGAAEARGEWLGFIDDDDVWAPDKLARQIRAARTTGRTWVYAGTVNVDDALRVIGGTSPPPPDEVSRLVRHCNVIPGGGSNVIVRRDEFERAGPFDLRLKNTEDWEMWIRLAKQGPPAWVPQPLLGYRVHSGNASLDVAAIFEGVTLIEDRHGTAVDRGVLHRWIAESCLRTGQRAEALKHMALATARGQGLLVAGDLSAILRRRVDRYLGHEPSGGARVVNARWIIQAEEWLQELGRL